MVKRGIVCINDYGGSKIRATFNKWELLQMYFGLCFYVSQMKSKGYRMTKSEILLTKVNNLIRKHYNHQSKKKNGK